MFKFWPWGKKGKPLGETLGEARQRVSRELDDIRDSLLYQAVGGDNCLCHMTETPIADLMEEIGLYKKPKENEMKKSEAKTKARKCFDTYEDRAASMMHDSDAGEYRVTYKGATGQRAGVTFEYTPEPPPIKAGVLCVGVSPHGYMSIGVSLGRLDPDGMLHCSSYLVRGNAEKRLKNARPVTPPDLVKWGFKLSGSKCCVGCPNEEKPITSKECKPCRDATKL